MFDGDDVEDEMSVVRDLGQLCECLGKSRMFTPWQSFYPTKGGSDVQQTILKYDDIVF